MDKLECLKGQLSEAENRVSILKEQIRTDDIFEQITNILKYYSYLNDFTISNRSPTDITIRTPITYGFSGEQSLPIIYDRLGWHCTMCYANDNKLEIRFEKN